MRLTTHLLVCVFIFCLAASRGEAQPPSKSVTGIALESIFSPHRAPEQKTMGLLQRSFLDLVESSERALQIALVVDGTDSMAADIEAVRNSLRNMVADLQRYKGDSVSFGLVVFRDSGSPSGEVSLLLNQFSSDANLLEEAFQRIQPETGEPYFLELADLGVHEAIAKLNWSEENEVTRWLILFADAPPYDADFVDTDASTGARRRYDTDLLINAAKRKQVQISSILCTSRDEEREVYEQVLDRTRAFMSALATGTGGLMLDLSYADIRAALVDAARQERVQHSRIGQITQQEVETLRRAAEERKTVTAASHRIRFAVLPHLPLESMSFDPDNGAVQIATELRQKLMLIPGTEVASPVDIDRAIRRLKSASVPEAEWLQTLAARLRVDYVVWGRYKKAVGLVRIESNIYSKTDGTSLVAADTIMDASHPETALAGDLITKLVRRAASSNTAPELVTAVSTMRGGVDGARELVVPVSNSIQVRNDLLAGFEALEQALAYPVGSDEGNALLEKATASLQKASDQDVRNPFAHLLLANCAFNSAQRSRARGEQARSTEAMRRFTEALKRAYRERGNAELDYLKLEIEADYNLLIKKDYAAAVALYQQLASAQADGKLHSALRAHWMLAGILSGDWAVPEDIVDGPQARAHLLQILAHWPDSHEATFIKRSLRWNEEEGRNEFEHFPLKNQLILTML